MNMEPVVPRVEASFHPEKPSEEIKVEEIKDEGDEQGVKRSNVGEAGVSGPSNKKIKVEPEVEQSKDVQDHLPSVSSTINNAASSNGAKEGAPDFSDVKNVIVPPKVEPNESQNMPTDYYSNGIYAQQQFPPQAPMQPPFQHQQPQFQPYPGHDQQFMQEQSHQQHFGAFPGTSGPPHGQPQYGEHYPPSHNNQYPQQHYPMHNMQQEYMPQANHQQNLPHQPGQEAQNHSQAQTPQAQPNHHQHQQQPQPQTSQSQQIQHFPNPPQKQQQQPQQNAGIPAQQHPQINQKQITQFGGITVTKNEPKSDNSYDVKAKLKEMGEISVEVKKAEKKKDSEGDSGGPTKKTEEETTPVVERKGNMRKNIREVMDETKLDESTIAAQRQEMERLRRVQEQQRLIRDLQRQANQDRVMSLLQGNEFPLEGQEGPSSTKIGSTVLVRLPNGQVKPSTKILRKPVDFQSSKMPSTAIDITPASILGHTNLTPSVSIAPVPKKFHEPAIIDDESDEERDPLALSPMPEKSDEPVDVIDLSSDSDDDCIVVSETDDTEEDEDPTNSGLHTNDEFNQPNEEGKVVINIGHADDEPDIFVAPQIARIIKPHQIGGIRFLYDNIIESTKMFETSTGFGCILAHSMGLGKTLQVVTFSDTFLRHTPAKTILCIMPINTLQNWLAEFNMWLPTEEDAKNSPLLVHGEVRPRNFNLHVLNDSHKTLAARAKVIHNWNTSGGVLLIGYEQYRLLSLKRFPKSRSKKALQRRNDDDKNKHLFDEVHEALVTPGPDLVVCDEGHRIKNSHASISQALKQMRTKRRVVLTGYPLQNNLMEYWCMVDFVRPNYLGTKTEFCNMFERPIQNGQCIDSTENDIKLMRYRAHVLHSLLLGFVQRRSHRVLQTALPQKEEYVLLLRMTDFQRTLYETFMNEVVRTPAVPNPLKAFAVCCKIWNHPDVLYYYLKKQAKGGAVDIDLEEVTTVTTAPVPAPVKKPRVKKQGKKEKPAASVTPYNSNNSTSETTSSATNSSTPSNSDPAPTPNTNLNSVNPTNPNNNFPNPNHNSTNYPPNMPHASNYPMPNYNAQMNPQMSNYSSPSNSNPSDYNRAGFNQVRPPAQYSATSSNQYMNAPGSYANQSNNYPMNNDVRSAYPLRETPQPQHYNPNAQQYSNSNYMQHPHASHNQPSMQHHQLNSQNPQSHHHHQPHQPQYQMNSPSNPNYPNPYPHSQHQQVPGANPGPGPSNQYNMMQPYNSNQSGYQNYQQNYPNHPNYPNQNYWNAPQPNQQSQNQQQQPYQQQDIKVEPYYNNAMPYDGNNPWIKQEDVKVKQEMDTKPKINILSDICISPEKKINILSDIKVEPKSEAVDISDEPKKEESRDEQKTNDNLDAKVEKTDLDEDIKCLSPVKLAEECTGIPYDWAIELLKDYVPGFIENSAKMEILFSIVRESLALGDRLLVFSQSLITLDLIEQFLQMNVVPGDTVKWAKNTSYYRLDGSTTALEREKLINEFNSNPKVHLFLVSTRAGSLGINLIGANRVIVLDASWNPCHDTQAVCRVYRYGQRKPCFVYRLVVDNCLEKKIYDRQINKQGMSDRVVDECNPDAHLTMKDVTTLCWDGDKETEEKDWSYCKDKYIDVVLQKVLAQHGKRFNKEPFQHESLLIDRKDKQLSSLEKRMAKRGYEREKQAARQPNYSVGTGVRHRPVASVRPMQQAETRSSKWIPAEHWQRQGMTAQEMTLPLDVVIPTVQPDKGKIVLKAGQKVLILKSPKGVYMQLESGKIVSIKTAIKVRGKVDEDSNNSTTPPSQPSPSPPPNIPMAIKHSPIVSMTPTTPPKRAVKPFVPTPRINIRGARPTMARLPHRPVKKVQMNKALQPVEEHAISSGDDEQPDDKRLNFPHRDGPGMQRQRVSNLPDRDNYGMPQARRGEVSMRDVRPVRHMSNQPQPSSHFNHHPKPGGAKGTSALQQLEKSTSAIISESKQPFQETLNSITKSYQEDDAKPGTIQPIAIDDEPEEKPANRAPPPPHTQTSTKQNIPTSSEYGNQYGNYYGNYNMQPYSAPQPHPAQPHPYRGYAGQTAPSSYDMSAYPPQSHQVQSQPATQTSQHQQAPPPPQQHQPPHHMQQSAQSQGYNYGYPPHIYSTPAPSQYPNQPYEYPAPNQPPPVQGQPMYSTPYSYQHYPPPVPAPPPVYSAPPPNPAGYSTDYQYPAPSDPGSLSYYPPQM